MGISLHVCWHTGNWPPTKDNFLLFVMRVVTRGRRDHFYDMPTYMEVSNSWKYLVVRKLPGWALLGRYPDDQRAEYADNRLGFQIFAICSGHEL